MAWLAGRWTGEGLGGSMEEMWLEPAAGQMVGVFRLIVDGRPSLYELMTIAEEEGPLTLEVKHFNGDFTGWEEPDAAQEFRLVRLGDHAVWFEGFTIFRRGDDLEMHVVFALGGEEREARLRFRRALGP